MEVLVSAIGMRCYGEDEFRECGKVTGGEKNRAREKGNDDGGSGYKGWPVSSRKPRRSLHHASTTPKMATRAPGSKPKVADDVARAVNTVPSNYRIAIQFESQITPKFL